jgi:2,4-dienoyl-CoA reductase-like NADH-dependent reductase (Old Yellow Enzyme family)
VFIVRFPKSLAILNDHAMTEKPFSPAPLGSLTLRNRLIKSATSEGLTPAGMPGDALAAFHTRLGEGGIGMTTVAYCAVEPDGRLHENQMHMHEAIAPQLRRLIDSVQATGAKVSGQMAHCGGFTKNYDMRRVRAIGPSINLNKLGAARGMLFCDAMDDSDIADMVQAYGTAAALMKDVGFDALEIHFGHGYALSQFISPKTNRRKDSYGGALENRMRLPLMVLDAVRDAVGDGFPILGKISMEDGVKGGQSLDEGIEIARMLDRAGIDGIVTSGGSSSGNPMMLFHGDSFLGPMLQAERHPIMRLGMQLAGPAMFKTYPYAPTYFRAHALRIREAVDCAVVYVGGAATNTDFTTLMNDGFDFIQLGRALLADPDLPNQAAADPAFQSRCVHCNECVATIEAPQGVHCPRF